jgi:hypothetical protein
MKLEDFAYEIAKRVFHELEHAHHFTVPEAIREAVIRSVRENLGTVIKP